MSITRNKDDVGQRTYAVERAPTQVAPYIWAVTRIALGWVFLWAFLDKTFGFGYATPAENAWIDGGSPTSGFLGNVEGLANNAFVDWLFMLALLGIGLAFILGIGLRIAAGSAVVLMILMWMAVLPIVNNPFLDDHLVYALVAVGLAASRAGDTWGCGKAWASTELVSRYPIPKSTTDRATSPASIAPNASLMSPRPILRDTSSSSFKVPFL
jgi:thiosulfate dehydrogenase [quinone] large subunit